MDCRAAISNLNPEAGLDQVGWRDEYHRMTDRKGSGINQGSTGICVSLEEEVQHLMDKKGSP